MTKEIGLKLKITSSGQEKVITNLQDLENELVSLQNTLKKQDFGSKQFQETARNIQALKSRIEDVDKATEGIGVEKRLRAIADTTNILTGSFQLLSGVIGTITTDEEALAQVQQAEAQALNVLNIALGVRAVQEGLLESRLLRREILEKALNATSKVYISTAKGVASALNFVGINAGVASTGVRALTSALSALGLPLLILGVSTLIDKFSELNLTLPKIKTGEDAYKDFNDELERTKSLTDARIESLEVEGDTLGALEETLRTAGIEAEKRNDIAIRLIDQRQRAINEGNKAEVERLTTLIDENLVAQIRVSNIIKRTEKEITKFRDDEEKKRTDKVKEENKKREELAAKNLQKRLEQQKIYFDDLNKLLDGELEVQAGVLDKINELIGRQQTLIEERTEFAKSEGEKLAEELNRLLFDIIPTEQERNLIRDEFLSFFNGVNGAVISGLDLTEISNLNIEQLIKIYNDAKLKIQQEIGGEDPVLIDSISIDEKAQRDLVQYFKTIQRITGELTKKENQGLVGKVIGLGDTETAQKIITGLISETSKLLSDTSLSQVEVEKKLNKIITDRLNLEEKTGDTAYNERLKLLIETLRTLAIREGAFLKGTDDVNKKINELGETADKNEEKLNRLSTEVEIFGIKTGEAVEKLTPTEITNLTNLLTQRFSASEDAFSSFITTLTNDTEGFRTKLLQVIDPQDLLKLIKDASTGLENITFETEQELTDFINFINRLQTELGASGAVGVEGYTAFNDVIEKLLENLKKIKDANKEAKTESESFLDGLTDVGNKVFEVYSNISGRLSNISQQNNAIVLEQLQRQEEQSLALIGDKTERQREEQLKLQREFAQKRFDIEKKARIQELQFTLANSIASGAQAVVNALSLKAPIPIPQLYAGVIAGLVGVEVATINSQIRNAESSVFIGRRGGLIQGGTHEQGGVPALLEGGEFVMSRPAVDRFGDIVGQLNQSVGGRGLQIDDSRIVQALSSQNATKTPIKTYVLYQDIKNTDKLNNRIEKLSRL